jgi:hypothetical protein
LTHDGLQVGDTGPMTFLRNINQSCYNIIAVIIIRVIFVG